jgi:hypothetical protein
LILIAFFYLLLAALVSAETNSQEIMAMKRLLKDGSTGLFYDGKGGWTADEQQACSYKDSSEAIRAFQQLLKPNMFLVLKFEDSRFDIATSLGNPEPPAPGKPLKPPSLIIGTVLPVAIEAIKAVSGRL